MSAHSSDDEESEVIDTNNHPEPGLSYLLPNQQQATLSLQKNITNRKCKTDETECSFERTGITRMAVILLIPLNFWKCLTDILKKSKTEFNL
jgi:hypothetical protein